MLERQYTIAEDGKSITCHFCGLTSHNQMDVANVYCGHCCLFHEVGLSTHREFVDQIAEKISSLLGAHRGYVLLISTPGENAEGKAGNHVAIASNIDPPQMRELMAQFLVAITPTEKPE